MIFGNQENHVIFKIKLEYLKTVTGLEFGN